MLDVGAVAPILSRGSPSPFLRSVLLIGLVGFAARARVAVDFGVCRTARWGARSHTTSSRRLGARAARMRARVRRRLGGRGLGAGGGPHCCGAGEFSGRWLARASRQCMRYFAEVVENPELRFQGRCWSARPTCFQMQLDE